MGVSREDSPGFTFLQPEPYYVSYYLLYSLQFIKNCFDKTKKNSAI